MRSTFLFLFFFQFSALAQCDSTDIIGIPDIDAQYPGGIVEMKRFIAENIIYPEIKRYDCFGQSRLYIKFIVCIDGSIQNIQLMRAANPEHTKIAINLIKKMPNWIPAKVNDEPVPSWCRLPLNIHLQ